MRKTTEARKKYLDEKREALPPRQKYLEMVRMCNIIVTHLQRANGLIPFLREYLNDGPQTMNPYGAREVLASLVTASDRILRAAVCAGHYLTTLAGTKPVRKNRQYKFKERNNEPAEDPE